MIKVIPYIKTNGTQNFKKFLLNSFDVNMLCNITENKNITVLFDGWKGKNMNGWYKFINDNGITLEFYPNHYIIIDNKLNTKQTLPLPQTINDIINDMDRFNIQLYWTKWIDLNFEPNDYLHSDEIKTYYVDLMNKMNKSYEIQ